ncbi:MAG TPA: FGGY family carbohydrate kinase [Chryseolinea sp.]|nr:FGGY family carbohydrate kinase [Chryseolinea sp.]HPH46018.1 FGGY family carbohydrate kinase [Chryseolinea sp.]
MPKPVIAIFDVGKTNKKLFLFDEDYAIVFEKSAQFKETIDEDGDPCENLESLKLWVFDSLHEVLRKKEFKITTVNFSTYGASFVLINGKGKTIAPLYNYLKPYPEELKKKFYDTYGGEEMFSFQTASPVLGNLNSGMQLYRIKHQMPELFNQIKYALHLPQYLSYLISRKPCSDLTSIGCHTNLWDFHKNDYHDWVREENILEKLAPIVPADQTESAEFIETKINVGTGMHDSSAALIPYLLNFHEPFVLISTGTWCISLNPFNHSPLTFEELECDCLCYLHYKGKPVKASRLFSGNEHDQQVKRISERFRKDIEYYCAISYNPEIIEKLTRPNEASVKSKKEFLSESIFAKRSLSDFNTYEEAYHQLMLDLITQQYISTQLVAKGTEVKRIFVDGGFSKNSVYMNLLASFFPEMEVFAASMAQATAVGTALAVHHTWNSKPMPNNIIELKHYAVTHDLEL